MAKHFLSFGLVAYFLLQKSSVTLKGQISEQLYDKFHSSHRANLLKKEPDFYNQYGWTEDPSDPYVWMDKEGKWYEQHSGKNGRVYYEALAI